MNGITVIIINYNGSQFAGKLIESLNNQTEPFAEIIIVDNASSDHSDIEFLNGLSRIRYIYLKENTGFPHAVNIAVSQARQQNILLLNNDIYLKDDFIKNALNALKQYKRTIFAPLVMDYAGKYIDSAGDTVPSDLKPRKRLSGKKPDRMSAADIDSVSMSCCFFRKKDFLDAGSLNDYFFLYFEDVDFSMRAGMAGFNMRFIPDCTAFHYISGSTKSVYGSSYSPLKVFYETRNRVLLIRNLRSLSLLRRSGAIIAGTLSSAVFFALRAYLPEFISGLWEGIHSMKRVSYYD
ncbi:MAG: glycosyltransferase family 2 protein [candidate division WOR-3 bacterium]|nr:glycosyltransferase family 2 protein [candidate division WOR-3 bacterium]